MTDTRAEEWLASRRWVARPAGVAVEAPRALPTMTPAECFASSYAPATAELVARLEGDTDAARVALAEDGWTPGETDAAMSKHEPMVHFGGEPLSGSEAAIWQRARTVRVHGTRARWTGERWYSDTHWLAEEDEVVPPDTRWTVIRTLLPNGRACKLWRHTEAGWGEPVDFALGTWVHVDQVEVRPGARGLHDLFETMSADPRACIVRAIRARDDVKIPASDARGLTSATGSRRGASAGAGAFLAPDPIGKRGVIFDVDKAALPAWFPRDRPPTPDEARRAVRELADLYLPRTWAGCELAYRWSASAGVRLGSLSLHIGVWLDRPVYDRPLFLWASTWGKPIDPKTLVSVQPIYGPPIFEGAPDPLEAAGIPRCGFLDGALAAVSVPAAVYTRKDGYVPLVDGPAWHAHQAEVEAERAAHQQVRELRGALAALSDTDESNDAWLAHDAAARLRAACDRILAAPHGVAGYGRHDTLLAESLKIGGLVAGGHLGSREAAEALLDAYLSVTSQRRRKEGAQTIADGFGRATPTSREELLAYRPRRAA